MPCFYPFTYAQKWPQPPLFLHITYSTPLDWQSTLLRFLLKGLDHVADLEALPAFEAHTALCASTHLLNILLDVLETGHDT